MKFCQQLVAGRLLLGAFVVLFLLCVTSDLGSLLNKSLEGVTAPRKASGRSSYASPPHLETTNVCDINSTWASKRKSLEQTAFNPLDNKFYSHHPIFSVLDVNTPVSFDPDHIIEETGLKVPYNYDCAKFDDHPYFLAVPSRWTRCAKHEALKKSVMRSFFLEYPLIDEEYSELIAVYTAVLAAPHGAKFRVVEMGARWGTWGSRAAMFARKARPDLEVELLFYEPEPVAAKGLHEVMRINQITSYHLVEGLADVEHFINYTSSWDSIDILDVDIQGAEEIIIPKILETLQKKAKRIIIGTHTTHLHNQMIALFTANDNEWISKSSIPFQTNIPCILRFRKTTVNNFPGGWDTVLQENCFHETSHYGPVAQWDGELIYDNAKFQQTTPGSYCNKRLT